MRSGCRHKLPGGCRVITAHGIDLLFERSGTNHLQQGINRGGGDTIFGYDQVKALFGQIYKIKPEHVSRAQDTHGRGR